PEPYKNQLNRALAFPPSLLYGRNYSTTHQSGCHWSPRSVSPGEQFRVRHDRGRETALAGQKPWHFQRFIWHNRAFSITILMLHVPHVAGGATITPGYQVRCCRSSSFSEEERCSLPAPKS